MAIPYVYNDGGREAAGFKGKTGDCVVRAIAIAAELPYRQVYDDLSYLQSRQRVTKRTRKGSKSVRNGTYTTRKWFKDYMAGLGFEWVSCMGIGTGCQVHLNADELPRGRIIVSLSRHYAAVIDGVLHDSYNSAERGVTVFEPGYPDIPAKAELMDNGKWRYAPERCVYGYWKKP